jgi:hypothetical protein
MFTALALLIPVVILGGLAALVYVLARGGRADDAFSSRTLLRAYLRLASMVSLVVFLIGAVNLLTAGFAGAFGQEFSYQTPYRMMMPQKACPPPGPGAGADADTSYQQCLKSLPPGGVEPADTHQQDDLIRGLSLMLTGLLLGAGHRIGLRALETPAERHDSGLARSEALLGTVAFGLASIVAVPFAAYGVLRWVILGHQLSPSGGAADAPGPALATALVVLPTWLFYLYGFARRARRPGSAGRAPAGPATEAAAG